MDETRGPRRVLHVLLDELIRHSPQHPVPLILLRVLECLQFVALLFYNKDLWALPGVCSFSRIINYSTLLGLMEGRPALILGILYMQLPLYLAASLIALVAILRRMNAVSQPSMAYKLSLTFLAWFSLFFRTVLPSPFLASIIYAFTQSLGAFPIVAAVIGLVCLIAYSALFSLVVETLPFHSSALSANTWSVYISLSLQLMKATLTIHQFADPKLAGVGYIFLILMGWSIVHKLSQVLYGAYFSRAVWGTERSLGTVVMWTSTMAVVNYFSGMEDRITLVIYFLFLPFVVGGLEWFSEERQLDMQVRPFPQLKHPGPFLLKAYYLADTIFQARKEHSDAALSILISALLAHKNSCNLLCCICRSKFQHTRDLSPSSPWFQLIYAELNLMVQCVGPEPELMVLGACIQRYELGHDYKALMMLSESQGKGDIIEGLGVFRLRQEIRNEMQVRSTQQGHVQWLSITRFLQFTEEKDKFLADIEAFKRKYLQFWERVSDNKPNERSIQDLGFWLVGQYKHLTKLFERLLSLNKCNAELMSAYGSFLSTTQFDILLGHQLVERAALYSGGLKGQRADKVEDVLGQKYGVNSEMGVVLLRLEQQRIGIIKNCNKDVRLLGYRKDDLVGENITVMMSPIFRGRHDNKLSEYVDKPTSQHSGRSLERRTPALNKDRQLFLTTLLTKVVPSVDEGVQMAGFIKPELGFAEWHERRPKDRNAYMLVSPDDDSVHAVCSFFSQELGLAPQPATAIGAYQFKLQKMLGVSLWSERHWSQLRKSGVSLTLQLDKLQNMPGFTGGRVGKLRLRIQILYELKFYEGKFVVLQLQLQRGVSLMSVMHIPTQRREQNISKAVSEPEHQKLADLSQFMDHQSPTFVHPDTKVFLLISILLLLALAALVLADFLYYLNALNQLGALLADLRTLMGTTVMLQTALLRTHDLANNLLPAQLSLVQAAITNLTSTQIQLQSVIARTPVPPPRAQFLDINQQASSLEFLSGMRYVVTAMLAYASSRIFSNYKFAQINGKNLIDALAKNQSLPNGIVNSIKANHSSATVLIIQLIILAGLLGGIVYSSLAVRRRGLRVISMMTKLPLAQLTSSLIRLKNSCDLALGPVEFTLHAQFQNAIGVSLDDSNLLMVKNGGEQQQQQQQRKKAKQNKRFLKEYPPLDSKWPVLILFGFLLGFAAIFLSQYITYINFTIDSKVISSTYVLLYNSTFLNSALRLSAANSLFLDINSSRITIESNQIMDNEWQLQKAVAKTPMSSFSTIYEHTENAPSSMLLSKTFSFADSQLKPSAFNSLRQLYDSLHESEASLLKAYEAEYQTYKQKEAWLAGVRFALFWAWLGLFLGLIFVPQVLENNSRTIKMRELLVLVPPELLPLAERMMKEQGG